MLEKRAAMTWVRGLVPSEFRQGWIESDAPPHGPFDVIRQEHPGRAALQI